MSTEPATPNPTPIVVPLDHLTQVCGYFNTDTICNNGYGCEHPDCDDYDLVKVHRGGEQYKDNIKYQIKIAAMRKAFGSVADIKRALETDDGKAYYEGLDRLLHDRGFVAEFGCKIAGRCFSFSCPVAWQADLEDLKEYDQELYEQYKDEEYGPHEIGADLMVISDPELISKLL
jgi:hypothetical protein